MLFVPPIGESWTHSKGGVRYALQFQPRLWVWKNPQRGPDRAKPLLRVTATTAQAFAFFELLTFSLTN